jgi:heptosyltransferase-2
LASLWNKFEQYFKHNYIKVLEKVFSQSIITPAEVRKDRIRRILVVRSHDQLGDFLLSTPALRALDEHFPNAFIGIVVRSYCADTIRNCHFIDEVLVLYENGFQWTPVKIWKLWHQLRKKWDLTVVLSSESHSLTSDLLSHLSRAKYILGSERSVFGGSTRNFFYNLIATDSRPNRHQSERNLDILRYIGVNTNDLSELSCIQEKEQTMVYQEYQPVYGNHNYPVIGLHIGANKVENRYPIANFCKLGKLLQKKYNSHLIIFWGPKENDLAAEFKRLADFPAEMIEPTSLQRQAVHFSLCDLVICNDTGIMHLCASVGTPLVAIFGPTNPKYWKPIGDSFVAVQSDDKRTASVTVEVVLQKVEEFLQKDAMNKNKEKQVSTVNV